MSEKTPRSKSERENSTRRLRPPAAYATIEHAATSRRRGGGPRAHELQVDALADQFGQSPSVRHSPALQHQNLLAQSKHKRKKKRKEIESENESTKETETSQSQRKKSARKHSHCAEALTHRHIPLATHLV